MEIFFKALLLSIAVSIDLMVCGIAYGINKTRTPLSKIILVNLVNSTLFGVALYFGYIIGQHIPKFVTMFMNISILCVLGILKILQHFYKKDKGSEKIKSSTLGFREAFVLGAGVALDAMAAGFGAGVGSGKSVLFCSIAFGISLVTDILLFYLGKFIGLKVSQKNRLNLNWLGGVILIGLGISKIFI